MFSVKLVDHPLVSLRINHQDEDNRRGLEAFILLWQLNCASIAVDVALHLKHKGGPLFAKESLARTSVVLN